LSEAAKPTTTSWNGRRVLVTGAGGFIGSHLVEHLVRAGARVRAFVRYNSRNDHGRLEDCEPQLLREVEIFTGDLANPEAVLGGVADVEVVLHLGALIPIPYSYRHPREFLEANLTGTLNVLEAARRSAVRRVVHISTSEVYGSAQSVPIAETHPLQAQSPYAATKTGADQLALSYWRSFELPVVVARPFNTFGPRQSARAVIPTIITQALSGDSIALGATTPTRDFLYVADTAAGIARCGEVDRVEGNVFNLGTGREIAIGEIADRVLALLGRSAAVLEDPDRLRPPRSEVDRLLADWSLAKRMLGWEPEVDFDEGLRRTIEWIRTSLHTYKPSIYNV
jgi:NAD dependent epimerase/dehydratase